MNDAEESRGPSSGHRKPSLHTERSNFCARGLREGARMGENGALGKELDVFCRVKGFVEVRRNVEKGFCGI